MKKKLRLTIRELCLKRGLKTAYALQRELGLYPTTASGLFNSDHQRVIKLDVLEKLMEGLDCELSDLIKVEIEKPAKASSTK